MTLSTARFYLPYNFVPATGKVGCADTPTATDTDIKNARAGEPFHGARHDRWVPGTYSGEFTVEIETKSPLFVGAKRKRDPNHPVAQNSVAHFERDGKHAIPGNTLRGVIGSVAEAISQSAMRVMQQDRQISVRKDMKGGALSAIGKLQLDKGIFRLRPLTLPTLMATGTPERFKLEKRWRAAFALNEPQVDLTTVIWAYLQGYEAVGNPPNLQAVPGTTLSLLSADSTRACYAQLPNINADISIATHEIWDLCIPKTHQSFFHCKRILGRIKNGVQLPDQYYLLGFNLSNKTLLADSPPGIRGFARVLGIDGRESVIPNTKKHELFVPDTGTAPLLRVNRQALESFAAIALECSIRSKNEQARGQTPFFPSGPDGTASVRSQGKVDDPTCWLRDGDLVYFDVNKEGTEVTEISYSSIWRRLVKGKLHDSVPKALRALDGGRKELTPAELLFGFVRENENDADPARLAAFASRLRFSDALPVGSIHETPTEQVLQILSSPKLPSPQFYFDKTRTQLRDFGDTKSNGRKVYLHHGAEQLAQKTWKSRYNEPKLAEQKVRIKPIEPGARFEFKIRFENLSASELTLLKTALTPSDLFHHKIGMAKPLGFGTCFLRITAEQYIDRISRYSADGFGADRFGGAMPEADDKLVDRASVNALCKIGDFKNGTSPGLEENTGVFYPRERAQLSAQVQNGSAEVAESKLFQWNSSASKNESQVLDAATKAVENRRPLRPFSAAPP